MKPRPPVGPGKSPALIPSCWGGHGTSPLSAPQASAPVRRSSWRGRDGEPEAGSSTWAARDREPYACVRGLQRGPSAGSASAHANTARLPPRGPPALTPGAGPGPETPLLPSTRGPQEAASPACGGVGGGAMKGLGPGSKTPTGRPSVCHCPATALEGQRDSWEHPQQGAPRPLPETEQLGAELGHSSVAWTEPGAHGSGLESCD